MEIHTAGLARNVSMDPRQGGASNMANPRTSCFDIVIPFRGEEISSSGVHSDGDFRGFTSDASPPARLYAFIGKLRCSADRIHDERERYEFPMRTGPIHGSDLYAIRWRADENNCSVDVVVGCCVDRPEAESEPLLFEIEARSLTTCEASSAVGWCWPTFLSACSVIGRACFVASLSSLCPSHSHVMLRLPRQIYGEGQTVEWHL